MDYEQFGIRKKNLAQTLKTKEGAICAKLRCESNDKPDLNDTGRDGESRQRREARSCRQCSGSVSSTECL